MDVSINNECAHPHCPRPTQLSNPGYATESRWFVLVWLLNISTSADGCKHGVSSKLAFVKSALVNCSHVYDQNKPYVKWQLFGYNLA